MSTIRLEKAPGIRWAMLLVYMVPYCAFFMALQSSVAFSADIQASLGISGTEVSLLMTAAMISFAFCCTLGGKLQAKIGPKKTNLCGIAVTIAASLLFIPFGDNYVAALVLRFLQGVGGGIMVTPTLTLSATWFPIRQRALANGIIIGVLGVGFTFATMGQSFVQTLNVPWNVGMGGLLAIVGAAAFVFFLLTARDLDDLYPGATSVQELIDGPEAESGNDDSGVAGLPTTLKEARRRPAYLASAIYGFGNAWILYGFGTFLAQLLTVDLGITSGLVTAVISSTFFVTIIFTPLGGIISDQLFKGSRYQTCMIGAGVTAVSLLLIVLFGSSSALLVAILLIFAYGSNSLPLGPLWAMVPEVVAPNIRSEYTGELNTISNFGGILAAPILATLMDVTGSAFLDVGICIAVAVASFFCALIIRR